MGRNYLYEEIQSLCIESIHIGNKLIKLVQ